MRIQRNRRLGFNVLPAATNYPDLFSDIFGDDEHALLPEMEHPAYGAIRVPDGRTLAWAEYGSARGVPCILVPDIGCSRLAPGWLLHDSALPSAVRLLALDRPGTGASDPVGPGGRGELAEDLRRLVDTLAVGRVAVIGIGQSADDVFAFARRYPHLVASVHAVSASLPGSRSGSRSLLHPFADRSRQTVGGVVGSWLAATGSQADLTSEATWVRALPKMSAPARTALGNRWQDQDFRLALATDLEQTRNASGTLPARGASAGWLAQLEGEDEGVPVQLWHGRQELPTGPAAIRAVVESHSRWQLTEVAGPTATLGMWPQILSAAAVSFTTASAA